MVNINVNGFDYPKLTGDNGVASLSNHLLVGEYTVTGVFCESIGDTSVDDYDVSKATVIDAQASKTVTVKKSWSQVSVVNSDNEDITSATVEKGTYVLCYLKDTGDEKITGAVVTLTVNGVSYTRVTDTDGCARLNINLTENTYDLQVGFAGTNSYESLVKNYELVVV